MIGRAWTALALGVVVAFLAIPLVALFVEAPLGSLPSLLREQVVQDAIWVTIKTNVLGLYRSHVNKDTSPDDVQVSCEKSGYKQAKVYRRTPPGAKDMFIETECTLQRL